MTLDRRAALAALAGFALAPGAALAQAVKTRAVPMKSIFQYLDAYLKIPPAERNLFTLAYYVELTPKPGPEFKAFYVGGGQRTPVPFRADGRFERLPTLAQLQAKHQLELTARAGSKFNVELALEPTARPAQEMDAAGLAGAVVQANRGIKRAAGVMRIAAPTMARVGFRGVGRGEVVYRDGRRAALPMTAGTAYFQPSAHPNAARLVFDRTPARMLIGPAPKGR